MFVKDFFFQYRFEMGNFLAVLRNISPVCLLQFSFDADMPGRAHLCQKFLREPSQSHRVMHVRQLHERGGRHSESLCSAAEILKVEWDLQIEPS